MKTNLSKFFCILALPLLSVSALTSCSQMLPIDTFELSFICNNPGVTISSKNFSLRKEFNAIINKPQNYVFKKLSISINDNILQENVDYLSLIDGDNIYIKIYSGKMVGVKVSINLESDIKKQVPDDYFLIDSKKVLLGFKENVDLTNYNSISIPSKVIEIAPNAFKKKIGYNSPIKYLEFNENLKKINDSAFEDCQGLCGNLILSNNIIYVGKAAFLNCCNFTGSINFGTYTSTIGDSAFENCTGFNGTINFSKNLLNIGNNTFKNCSNLVGNLWTPNSLVSIGNNAFENCTGLNGSLLLNDELAYIGSSAFKNCSNLTQELFLPSQLVFLGDYAFSGCSKLSGNLDISKCLLTSIGNFVFEGCSGFDGSLLLPDALESIGDYAFSGCSGLSGQLIFPFRTQTIGTHAFENCSSFSSMSEFPPGLSIIPEYCFSGCKNISWTFHVSENVTSIKKYAFADCKSFYGDLTIPDTVKNLEEGAFAGCSGLEGTAKLPSNITKIPNNLFNGCSKIDRIDYVSAEHIYEIGDGTFSNCTLLNKLPNLDYLNKIGNYSFFNCTSLTQFKFDLKIIYGEGAFKNCSSLQPQLEFSNGAIEIGDECFSGCKLVTSISFAKKLDKVGSKAFSYLTSLKTIDFSHLEDSETIPEWLIVPDNNIFIGANPEGGEVILPQNASIDLWKGYLYNYASLPKTFTIKQSQ